MKGERHQTLLGITGSRKTFTMANVIANLNRFTLMEFDDDLTGSNDPR